MGRRLIECVPNFSEGRDPSIISALKATVCSVDGVYLLHSTSDPDHNRTVLTFVGEPPAASEAAFRGVAKAVELIDLTRQSGAHPRIGAADVVPLVPLEGITLAECATLATALGERIWSELGVPVYLYESAARMPDRRNLESIREGGFERLRDEVRTNPLRKPDLGQAELHPTAGATVVGARKLLVAFNILLDTADVAMARRIARTIRTSSGGLPCVKAMGVRLASRNLAQVSINLTDFEITSPQRVFDAVSTEAASEGVAIRSSEIIGLIPQEALSPGPEYLKCENFSPGLILENRLATIQLK
jgi:glutamate formiminotransferase